MRNDYLAKSGEGEVIAASDACREIVWLKRLLKRITCLKNESVLYIDNKGSVTRLGLTQKTTELNMCKQDTSLLENWIQEPKL